jgi:hypothetical protein
MLYSAQIPTTNSKPGATNSKAAEAKSKEIDRKSKPKTTKTKLDFLPQIEPFQGVALTFRASGALLPLDCFAALAMTPASRLEVMLLLPAARQKSSPRSPRRSGAGAAGRRKGCRQFRSSETYSTTF